MTRHYLVVFAALVGLAGCATDPEGPTSPVPPPGFAVASEDQLAFLRLDANAPALAQTSVSFYAVRGKDREAAILYTPRPGLAPTRLARIRVLKESLVNRPDGTPIAVGDSVLITMTVVDPSRQLVDLQPSGLTFSSRKPAKLWLWYLETDHDFNDDGVIDAADLAVEATFDIWAQENPGGLFTSLKAKLGKSGDELQVGIPGFTRYIIAY
jgi:hypothetical protein